MPGGDPGHRGRPIGGTSALDVMRGRDYYSWTVNDERRKEMYRRTLVIFLGLLLLSGGCGGGGGAIESGSWISFNEGMEMASRTGRPVIIDFYTSWCRWCKVMDRETFSDPEVKDFLEKNFVTVRIDAENRTEQLRYRGKTYTPVQLTRKFAVRAYPSLAYLESDGSLIAVVPGFKKPDVFMPTLKYIKDGCYRNDVSLEDYIRKGECGG